MKKAFFIAWKDFLIRLNDRTGFAFLIITPLIITLIMGAVFGGDDDDANFRVAVTVINQDVGSEVSMLSEVIQEDIQNASGGNSTSDNSLPDLGSDTLNFGDTITEILTSDDMGEILNTTLADDEATARAAIEAGGSACCVVIIPKNFSEAILLQEAAKVEIYSDPAQDIGRQIVESIVRQLVNEFSSNSLSFDLAIEGLFQTGRISSADEAMSVAEAMAAQFETDDTAPTENLITLETINAAGNEVAFDPLSFFAPSLAIMFLAFGAAGAAQSIREEEDAGTLDRLNAAPLSGRTILFGKVLGTFWSSGLQFGILLLASVIIFGLRWGNPVAVIVMALLVTIVFTCLGLVIAVIAKSASQASVISNAVLLTFALIGGNLTPASNFPEWLRSIAQITPNYWSVQAFIKLGQFQGLPDLRPEIIALASMSIILFITGSLLYRRRMAART